MCDANCATGLLQANIIFLMQQYLVDSRVDQQNKKYALWDYNNL